jgi:hypothetical protein
MHVLNTGIWKRWSDINLIKLWEIHNVMWKRLMGSWTWRSYTSYAGTCYVLRVVWLLQVIVTSTFRWLFLILINLFAGLIWPYLIASYYYLLIFLLCMVIIHWNLILISHITSINLKQHIYTGNAQTRALARTQPANRRLQHWAIYFTRNSNT